MREIFIVRAAYDNNADWDALATSLDSYAGAFFQSDATNSALVGTLVTTAYTNFKELMFVYNTGNTILRSNPIPVVDIIKIAKVNPLCEGTGLRLNYTTAANPGAINQAAPTVVSGGTGYKVGDIVTIPLGDTASNTTLCRIAVTAVTLGVVTATALIYGGVGYIASASTQGTTAQPYTATLGSGCSVTVTIAGNTITAPVVGAAMTIATAGTGYKVGDVLTICDTTNFDATANATCTVTTVSATGGVTGATLTTAGTALHAATGNLFTQVTTSNYKYRTTLTYNGTTGVTPISGQSYIVRVTDLTKHFADGSRYTDYEYIAPSGATATTMTNAFVAGMNAKDVPVTLAAYSTNKGLTLTCDNYGDMYDVEILGTASEGEIGALNVNTVETNYLSLVGEYANLSNIVDDYSTELGNGNSAVNQKYLWTDDVPLADEAYVLYLITYTKTVRHTLYSDGSSLTGTLILAVRGDKADTTYFDTILGV